MQKEILKIKEKCNADRCACSHRGESLPKAEKRPVMDQRENSELYNKEVESYYFYFQTSKAS